MKEIDMARFDSQAEARESLSEIVVLHIPHSSGYVPQEERRAIRLDDQALETELLRMTDAYTDQLFPLTPVEAHRVICPVTRLIRDVERFPLDEDEPMSARGMGVIYTRTSMGDVLRAPPDPLIRKSLLDRWYWPHHSKLERVVNDAVTRLGRCLIIDCHSFPSAALPYELDQTGPRADFCVGTDAFHTPPLIRDAIVAAAKDAGYSVTVDTPFAGALVPLAFYRNDRRIWSVMIEVNRRLYMDEHSGAKGPRFEEVRAVLARLIVAAAEAAVGRADQIP
jgi:N-formylglutamate amidohydrolase